MNDAGLSPTEAVMKQVPDQINRLGEIAGRLQDYVTQLEERTATARDANKVEVAADNKIPDLSMCGLARTIWEHNNQMANDLIRLANVTDALEL